MENRTETIQAEMIEWRWIDRYRDMQAIKGAWQSLHAELNDGSHIFQAYSWCSIWTECFIERHNTGWSLLILSAWQGDDLLLLCPLAVKRHGPVRIAHWLGEPMTHYGEVLVRADKNRDAMLDAMWQQIAACPHFDIARLNHVREDALVSDYLMQHGAILVEEEAVSLKLSSFDDWDALEAWYMGENSRNTRRRRKQSNRYLSGMGDIEMVELKDPAVVSTAIDDVLRFKAMWLEQNGLRSSTFADPVVLDLLHDLVITQEDDLHAFLFRMTINGEPAAYDVGFLSNGRYVQHIGSYNPDYSRGSPGNHLMERSMDLLLQQGVKWFDLMAPAYDYKLKWGSHRDTVRAFALPVSLSGKLYMKLYLQGLRPGLKHVLDNLPLPLKRLAKQLQDRIRR